jgi:hypothetical protein
VFCAHLFGGGFAANDEIADCGLAIVDYQRERFFNPKSAIWLRPNAALG